MDKDKMILFFIFCALVRSGAHNENRTSESYEAFGFNGEQLTYILKKKLEISELKTTLTKWKPMVDAYSKNRCENLFRRVTEHIENEYVTNIVFINAFPSLFEVMNKSIDSFNEIRIKTNSASGPINKSILEKRRSIPKNYFQRREKWFILSKWFIELKNVPEELARLEKEVIYKDLYEFREKMLHKFQNGTLTLVDDEVPDKVGSAFPGAWRFITGELKRHKEVVTQEDLEIFLSSFPYRKLGLEEKTCIYLVVFARMRNIMPIPGTR